MDVKQAMDGLLDAESKLSSRGAVNNPSYISREMYRLGQYASALEKNLGDAEEEFEKKWAKEYTLALESKLSATAAKQQADVQLASDKGNIKRLTRYVGSSWKIYTGAMARVNHLEKEQQGMRSQT